MELYGTGAGGSDLWRFDRMKITGSRSLDAEVDVDVVAVMGRRR